MSPVHTVTAYTDVVKRLQTELDEAETELLRTPDNAVILGTIIALGKVLRHFVPAPDLHRHRSLRNMSQVIHYCNEIGLVEDAELRPLMDELERCGHAHTSEH